jgi:alkaline phosphatase D
MLRAAALFVVTLGILAREGGAEIRLTHGTAVGEVTSHSAVVWARADAPGTLVVRYETDGSEAGRAAANNAPERDFTARVSLDGLRPGTRYRYRARFESGGDVSEEIEGSFQTAPDPSSDEPIRFIVAGDLGGHGWCREVKEGYRAFDSMRELEPLFFVANGDMIYADTTCPPERPDGGRNLPADFRSVDDPRVDWTNLEEVREIYLAHWRYNQADPHFQRFLLQVPIYSQWDDHEVINDFGAPWTAWTAAKARKGYPTLVRAGREAFFDFHPLSPPAEEPERIYRSFRWGAEVELFLLDARSYRSENDRVDSSENRKTLLGERQLDWLKKGLAESTATWKIVSTDVPLSIPTGTDSESYGHDAFANGSAGSDDESSTGFERELRSLLVELDRRNVRNVVFVATDVHFAASLRYDVDVDGDGDRLLFHELISGPLSAGLVEPRPPDPTFGPRVLYTEGGFFNFSLIRILPATGTGTGTGTGPGANGGSRLVSDIRDVDGKPRVGSTVEITAER